MVTRINELKTLLKHISSDHECRFDGRECNLNQKWNSNECQCDCKKYHICKKKTWNPSTCTCDIDGYLKGIVNNLTIVCDYIM